MSDPEDVPGLAHFLEHMLFYSSEKYPEEDAYSKYIAEKGGSTNAYTANESTNYHFDVNWESLEEALDRFAQFFISPMISPDGVERESKAVDSEHKKNLNSDPWKQLQLWKTASNPKHPFNKFSTGDYSTLIVKPTESGMSPHEKVVEFYRQRYSANLMKLVVLSRHSLEELERMVVDMFQGVENKGFSKNRVPEDDVLTDDTKGIVLKTVPQREGHTLEIQWLTLPEERHYRESPSNYISHLLGHEGPGSLFALLKHKGLAHSLSAGEAGTSFSSRSFFCCKIDLTDEGHQHVKEIIKMVFEYLAIIKSSFEESSSCSSLEIWNEMVALADLRFNYREKMNAYSYVSSLSHALQVYDAPDLLRAMYHVPFQFNENLIKKVLHDLTVENARIMWCSKSLESEGTLRETWYGTPYSLQKLPTEWVDYFNSDQQSKFSNKSATGRSELYLPELNDFIPSNFSLVETHDEEPRKVMETQSSCLWMRLDPSFRIPKAVVCISLYLPEAYTSPKSATLSQLLVKLVNDNLNETSYPAQLAGLHYGLRSTAYGLSLTLSGYHHTIGRLANLVISTLIDMEVKTERFDFVRNKLKREYMNIRFEQPYRLALYEMDIALESKKWHISDYEKELEALCADDLRDFIPVLFSRCRLVFMSSGNLSQSSYEDIASTVENSLKKKYGTKNPHPSQYFDMRVAHLNPGESPVLKMHAPNPDNENSAVVVAFQGQGEHASTMMQLLAHIGKREAFYQLRTVEQLGYITFFSTYHVNTVTHLIVLVQSSSHGANHVDRRIMEFLPSLKGRIEEMSEKEFFQAVEELIKSKLEKAKRLKEKSMREWQEIVDETYRFNRREQEVNILKSITAAALIKFVEANILSIDDRKMFRVHVHGAVPKAGAPVEQEAAEEKYAHLNEHSIDNIFEWKKRQNFYPHAFDIL